ncbi:hypothetical protein C2G38_2150884, partial [Gigaspora rosea]
MANTQSKIDSLEEQNSKLVAEISELRKKYTKVEAENVKLRHIIEESTGLKTRFEELERKNKTDTDILIAENIELKNRVTKLEQKRIQVITNESSTKDILPPSVCSELPVIYQREIKITSATSNLSEIEKSSESASSICTETKLLEDREKISNEIRERNRENRFRSQDPLSYDKDISQSNKNKVQKFMSEVSGSSSPQLNRDVTSATSNETKFQPSNTNFTLLYEKLCDAIILADRKTQEAIMCYYLFGKALIQRRNEIASEQQVDPESNIVSRILNKEVKAQLPADTSDSLLRKRIEKAKKLYRLFDAIGMDKIYRIHSFSADSISKLTKKEIQYIIDNVSFDYSIQIELHSDEKNPEHMTQLCEPSSRKKLPDTEVSISHVNTSNKSQPPIFTLPDDPKEKQAHIIKMVLDRFSRLSLKYSNKYGDYFTCSKICPI